MFPGGCFFASAAAEFDTHPGAVRERISEFQRGWTDLLVQLVREAQAAGQLRAEDPDQLVFELNGYLMMANMAFLLYGSGQPIERAREAVAARLASSPNAPVAAPSSLIAQTRRCILNCLPESQPTTWRKSSCSRGSSAARERGRRLTGRPVTRELANAAQPSG